MQVFLEPGSYGFISHVACTYSYFLRYWKPNSVRCLPSFLPRELLLSIFPILEDGGRRADSWCWRAPCHLHVYMDSAAQLRPLVYTPEREMDSFSFL